MDSAAHPQQRATGRLVVLAVVLASLSAVVPAHAATGLVEVSRTALSARLLELTMRTPALPTDTHVRVLLPAGYATSGRRYPVLYLLNGGGGSYLDWTVSGNAEALTAHAPVIVVMPDGGTGGNYTDWYGTDQNGFKPRWETFHIGQLLPWVDAHFRTLPTRDQRAVGGLSMGGNGALHYAERHPDLFVAVASFSGANDVFQPTFNALAETTGISDGVPPGAVFGPQLTQEVRWRAFNPPDLAGNLRSTWVSLAFGNGQPGGPESGGLPADPIEMAVHDANVTTHDDLVAAGVPHLYDDYGAGNHSWGYWSRDLSQALPRILAVFAQHRTAPTAVTYSSADPAYSVFGWSVLLDRPVLELSHLVGAHSGGFALQGTGRAVVTTPAGYAEGQQLTVHTTDARGTRTVSYTVGDDRRVQVEVDLGAPNPYQQYTTQSDLTGTTVREARVSWSTSR
jgi:S-formylglutathione hydrolase FrmB